MFTKNYLSYSIIKDYDLNVPSCEELWVKVSVNGYGKVFGVLYRHQVTVLHDFHSAQENSLEIINDHKYEYYICSDININLLKSEPNNAINNYSNMSFSLGSLSLINFPT